MLTDPPPAAPVRGAEPLGGCDAAVSAARRDLADVALLNLAVLLHDCGKGTDRDHSVVGAELCGGVADRLGLSGRRRDRLVWLVAHHLKMTHLALRRDTADPALLFRVRPGRGRRADAAEAVRPERRGPAGRRAGRVDGVEGGPAGGFLRGAKRVLDGGRPATEAHAADLRRRAAEAFAAAGPPDGREGRRAWADGTLSRLSPHLVAQRPTADLAGDLELLHGLPPGGAAADARFDPHTGTTEYRLAAAAGSPGLFARLAGVLAARRLGVVEAVVESLEDGGVLDLFRVVDGDFPAEPAAGRFGDRAAAAVPVAGGVPDWRTAEVCDALAAAAHAEIDAGFSEAARRAAGVVPLAEVPRAIAAACPFAAAPPALPPDPPRVTCDTESSDTARCSMCSPPTPPA